MKQEIVHLQAHEYEFHEAGAAQGRAAAMLEGARELRKSREHYLAQYEAAAKEDEAVAAAMDNVRGFLQVFESLAAQFEAEGRRAEKTIERHMTRGVAQRPVLPPTLRARIIGAMIGAARGYKTGSRPWQENEFFPEGR